MAWTEQDSIDYWKKRYPSTREQLTRDLPKDEYESEYPLVDCTQGLEFEYRLTEWRKKKTEEARAWATRSRRGGMKS